MCRTATENLDTPLLVVDRDSFDANVALLLSRVSGATVRPHLKTAKSPVVARLLQQAGCVGICVAKVSEAEVMLEAGLRDVMITTEITGDVKAGRFAEMVAKNQFARVRVVVDSLAGALFLDTALDRLVEVLVDVNVGQGRCGVNPDDAGELAAAIAEECPRLRVVGVQGYEGHLQHVRSAEERRAKVDEAMGQLKVAADGVVAAGVATPVVSTGGTGTAHWCAEHEHVTEVQPGSFAFMDVDYGATEDVPYAPALSLVASVVSSFPDRVVIDAGLKALSNDSGDAVVVSPAGWRYRHAGDEHGVLTGGERLIVGDRVVLRPSHIDTTINLHDELVVVSGEEIVERWPVAARGCVQ